MLLGAPVTFGVVPNLPLLFTLSAGLAGMPGDLFVEIRYEM